MALALSNQGTLVASVLAAAAGDKRVVEYVTQQIAQSGAIPRYLKAAANKGGDQLKRIVRERLSNQVTYNNRRLGPTSPPVGVNTSPSGRIVTSGSATTLAMAKGAKNTRKGKGKGNKTMVPRPMGFGATNAIALRGVLALGNTGANVLSYQIPFAINSTIATSSSAQTLGSVFGTALTNWVAIYRQWRPIKAIVRYVTGAPNTLSGNVMIGVDPDPLAGLAGSYQNVIRHTASLNSPVFANGATTWTPISHRDREDKFTTSATSNRTESELSFGTIQIYSQNSAASGTTLGVLEVDVWVVFSDPC